MRSIGNVFLILAILNFGMIFNAAARAVVDVATLPMVGCDKKEDIIDLIRAGQMRNGSASDAENRADKEAKSKLSSGKCFFIASGQMAYSAPEWQNANDIWSGISVLSTKSGRRFYSVSWNWKYVGEIPNFVEPPNMSPPQK